MNELLEQIRDYIRQRSLRERWMIVLGVCVIAMIGVHQVWAQPLQATAAELDEEIQTLELNLMKSEALVRSVRRLQGELSQVETVINSEEKPDLLSLLERLARLSTLEPEQLESITPKQTSSTSKYPETRVEVRLKGTTLNQTVDFLYKIGDAPEHLIIRSLRITTRGKEEQVLDVSFSVSSFESA